MSQKIERKKVLPYMIASVRRKTKLERFDFRNRMKNGRIGLEGGTGYEEAKKILVQYIDKENIGLIK